MQTHFFFASFVQKFPPSFGTKNQREQYGIDVTHEATCHCTSVLNDACNHCVMQQHRVKQCTFQTIHRDKIELETLLDGKVIVKNGLQRDRLYMAHRCSICEHSVGVAANIQRSSPLVAGIYKISKSQSHETR